MIFANLTSRKLLLSMAAPALWPLIYLLASKAVHACIAFIDAIAVAPSHVVHLAWLCGNHYGVACPACSSLSTTPA